MNTLKCVRVLISIFLRRNQNHFLLLKIKATNTTRGIKNVLSDPLAEGLDGGVS